MYRFFSSLCIVTALAGGLRAEIRTGGSYTSLTDTTDSAGGRASAALYTDDASVGGLTGAASVASPPITDVAGYIAQIADAPAVIVASPVITSAGAASGTAGLAFSYQILATNSPTSYNATGLPAGLSVNTGSGLISGTPAAAGTSTVTLSATNVLGTGSATLTLTVNDADSDGDGQSDASELLAGTNPNDPRSTLRAAAATVNPATGAVTVTFASVAGKTYRLQRSPDLTGWTDIGSSLTAAGAVTGITATLSGTPLTGKGFLRVRVVP